MLTQQNEGLRGFHVLNRNQWGERWQAVEKKWEKFSKVMIG
jgi:3-methyladenine DNA glycosylase Tag